MSKKLVIVDYHLGNIFSVQQACKKLGFNSEMSSSAEQIMNADAIILPGVGAFGDAMTKIQELHLDEALKSFHQSGRPIMGICLGMQLIFDKSYEYGEHAGLGLVQGEILKFPEVDENVDKIKVPQTGWNNLIKNPDSSFQWKDTPLKGLTESDEFYFVHSYYASPSNKSDILTFTEYGGLKYCSTIKVDNIFATQFHPEKSGEKGLEIYENWLKEI